MRFNNNDSRQNNTLRHNIKRDAASWAIVMAILIATLMPIIFMSGCDVTKNIDNVVKDIDNTVQNDKMKADNINQTDDQKAEQTDDQTTDQTNDNDKYIEDFVKSKYENKEAGHIETIIEYGDNILISAHYPLFGIEKLDNLTKTFILKYINDFKEQTKGNKYENVSFKDELNIDYETWAFNDKIVSIKYSVFMNMPYYAHPDTRVDTAVYDLNSQNEIHLDDIMQGDYLSRISELTIKNLSSNEKYSDYLDSDIFKTGIKPIKENYSKFILKKDKIVFSFQKYQIFPGAAGEPEVEISYNELEGFMKPLETLGNDKGDIPEKDKIDKIAREIDPEKPIIALTFDDGPYAKSTISILDTLKENNAVATFFVLGNRVSSNKSILERMIKEGNEIGNHSYNHKQLTTLSDEGLREQIEKTQNIIEEIVGFIPKVMRPTYGSHNERMRNIVDLPMILWTIDTEDWKSKNAKAVSDHVLKNIKDGSIVLMHDIYGSTSQAVKVIVPELIKQGYQLVTISELYELKGMTLEAGIVYREIK